ncbi:NAD(P)-dependent dehydrogenase (short-subunit alcohol dehydrogenase family) [Bacillus mesophilus]|uniref:SDR family oxidoreductase n=1 Tax=Bacillus mesophilus TaxID=1808955 RepID=A0A6M0QBD6_9BACI|nr:oxidoreductase [Bacillus mesophilus]MBM7663034.1 NAD(P)-dependent dehydrogenase (short-subunit alcohol dehydrogenase family) [Bacillus mesophilus]NEY73645.1 SDR family oxidoreductase [Bacillus mesophilus]
MSQPVAVVTGSSSGFGLLTCLTFARAGYRVIATMRNIEKSEHLLRIAKQDGVDSLIHVEELDVTSDSSIEKFQMLMQQTERIDVLVNNAGYAGAGFVEEIPVEEYRKQFETNVFGVISVTQSILPMMRKQGSGKIINVSSISGRIGFPGLSPYIASKHALEGWSESLRLEMKPFGIDVVLIEPGSYQTNIWSTGKSVTEKSLLPNSPYYGTMKKIEDHLNKEQSTYGNPQDVASLILNVVKQKDPPLRIPIGKGVKMTIALKQILPWHYWERMFLKKLK